MCAVSSKIAESLRDDVIIRANMTPMRTSGTAEERRENVMTSVYQTRPPPAWLRRGRHASFQHSAECWNDGLGDVPEAIPSVFPYFSLTVATLYLCGATPSFLNTKEMIG